MYWSWVKVTSCGFLSACLSDRAFATRMLPFSSHIPSTSPLLSTAGLGVFWLFGRLLIWDLSTRLPPEEASERSLLVDADLSSAAGFGVFVSPVVCVSVAAGEVVSGDAAGTSTPRSLATFSAARSRCCGVLDARLRESAYAPAACLNLARFSTLSESAMRASAFLTALAHISWISGSGSVGGSSVIGAQLGCLFHPKLTNEPGGLTPPIRVYPAGSRVVLAPECTTTHGCLDHEGLSRADACDTDAEERPNQMPGRQNSAGTFNRSGKSHVGNHNARNASINLEPL